MNILATPLDRYLRHRRLYEIALWTLAALMDAAANTVTVIIDNHAKHIAVAQWKAAVWEFSSCLILLALVPGVLALERHFPFRFADWTRSLRIHALATVPFSLIHVATMVGVRKVIYRAVSAEYTFGNDPLELLYEYLKDCRTYAVILGGLYAYRFFLLQLQGEAHVLPGSEQPAPPVRPERLLVRKLGKEFLMPISDIEWLEASGNYVNLHVRGRSYPLRSTMAAMEPRLDPKKFQRVHRSYIVNLDQLSEIEPLESGEARLKMKDGTHVPCSRRYRDALRVRGA